MDYIVLANIMQNALGGDIFSMIGDCLEYFNMIKDQE